MVCKRGVACGYSIWNNWNNWNWNAKRPLLTSLLQSLWRSHSLPV